MILLFISEPALRQNFKRLITIKAKIPAYDKWSFGGKDMSDTPKVRCIPAYRKSPHLLNAGSYVRVSTARVEQLRSLSNQASAMTRYVYSRENWILKDIYLEVGSAKTGTSRREFTRLVESHDSLESEAPFESPLNPLFINRCRLRKRLRRGDAFCINTINFCRYMDHSCGTAYS